jgi:hypothetical protein
MRFNADGDIEDDGSSAEDEAKIDAVEQFFRDNYKSSTDPLNCVYLTTMEIFMSLAKVFPDARLTVEHVTGWLEGSFRRKDIGEANGIKIVWAVDRKVY